MTSQGYPVIRGYFPSRILNSVTNEQACLDELIPSGRGDSSGIEERWCHCVRTSLAVNKFCDDDRIFALSPLRRFIYIRSITRLSRLRDRERARPRLYGRWRRLVREYMSTMQHRFLHSSPRMGQRPKHAPTRV